MDDRLAVDVVEAERLTSVSRYTWRKYIKLGKVAAVRVGRRVLISVAELERIAREGLPAKPEDGQPPRNGHT
jgi:excisionase family DNA binding protein